MNGQNIGDRPRPRDNFKKKVGRGHNCNLYFVKKKIKNFKKNFKISANNTKKNTFNTRIHLVSLHGCPSSRFSLCSERDTWHVTHDTWHMTCDTWHMTRSEHSLHGCPSSRLGLTKCILVLNVTFLYYLPRSWIFFCWNFWIFFLATAGGRSRPILFWAATGRERPILFTTGFNVLHLV